MEFENIEQVIIAMQSSQFSMEEKKEILVDFFKSLSQQEAGKEIGFFEKKLLISF